MKVAWVTLAIAVAAALGLLLISLFGDITVTNQQDYTLMKNAAEAAMYDAKDIKAYNDGMCICTNKEQTGGKFVFGKANEYYVQTVSDKNASCESMGLLGYTSGKYKYCVKRAGEFKINKELFSAAFVRRFAESVKGDNEYKIDILDVVEYPPKVSIKITSYDNYQVTNSTEGTFDSSDYVIVNDIDGIIENSNADGDDTPIVIEEAEPEPEPPAPPPSKVPFPTATLLVKLHHSIIV